MNFIHSVSSFALLAAETAEASDLNFRIDVPAFMDSLGYMGKGMAGIFIITGVIVLCTMALNAIFSRKADQE